MTSKLCTETIRGHVQGQYRGTYKDRIGARIETVQRHVQGRYSSQYTIGIISDRDSRTIRVDLRRQEVRLMAEGYEANLL